MINNTVIFALIVGILTGPVVYASIFWAKDLKLKMNWWKWLLTAIWYVLLLFFILADFTLIGEGEPGAGWKFLAFQVIIMVILGVGLFRLLLTGKKK
jgi:hypothetical protein